MESDAREIDELLGHAEWVRALARALVRDPGAADDVVQETWLAALRHPRGAGRSAQGWLGAVARNAARQLGRAEVRRAWRERRAARPEALPTDEELDERVARQHRVVGEVMALDEPYRRVVVLRYFEGLPPSEIAARTGLPLETVKSRLRRALQRLRRRLDAQRGPDGAGGLLALLPLATEVPRGAAAGAGVVLMEKKALALAAVALAVLLGGALYFGALGPQRSMSGGALEERGELSVADPRESAPAADEPAPLGAAEQRAPDAPEDLRRIRTIEQGSGLPVGEVDVWILSWTEWQEHNRDDGRGESVDVEAVAAAHGRRYRTDERGELAFAAPDAATLAVARRGELFGVLQGAPAAGTVAELPLLVDRSLVIQAVTESGEPLAGVPVGLATCDPGYPPQVRWWARTHGDAGTVTLHHVDQTLARHLGRDAPWEATLATPWLDPPRVPLDPREPRADVVRLVVSRGATVVVRLEDEAGALLRDTWIYLTPVGDERDAVGRPTRATRHDRYARDGVARFEGLAPGLELIASAAPAGHRHIEQVVMSPSAPGEELVVRLRCDQRLPVVRGTLVDPAGAPLSKREMELRAWTTEEAQDGRAVTGRFRTDEAGRFEASVRTRKADDVLGAFELTTNEAYEGAALAAWVSVTTAPADDVYELGRVTLSPPPVMLAGRVIDARGEPIYWAGVWVKRVRADGDAGGPPYEWVHAWQTQTDEDGRFECTGDEGPGDYRLRVAKDGFLPWEDVPVQPGATGLELVLRRGGGLEGRLRLPEGVPPEWLRVSASAVGGGARADRALSRPHPDGRFVLSGLAPGDFDVEVRVPAWAEPLARVARVHVEDGVTRADPRLMGLDLRQRIFRIDLDVQDAAGDPVPVGRVAFALPDGRELHHAFVDGVASLLSPTPTGDAEVIAPGFRPQDVPGARDGTRVVLERGIPVRVRLPADFELPEPPLQLVLELLPARMEVPDALDVHADDGTLSGRWSRAVYGVEAAFEDASEVTLAVGSAGEWQVGWRLRGERGSAWLRGARSDPQLLRIDEPGPPGAIELSPDPDDLARVLAGGR